MKRALHTLQTFSRLRAATCAHLWRGPTWQACLRCLPLACCAVALPGALVYLLHLEGMPCSLAMSIGLPVGLFLVWFLAG